MPKDNSFNCLSSLLTLQIEARRPLPMPDSTCGIKASEILPPKTYAHCGPETASPVSCTRDKWLVFSCIPVNDRLDFTKFMSRFHSNGVANKTPPFTTTLHVPAILPVPTSYAYKDVHHSYSDIKTATTKPLSA
ncbi:hypothetical protein QQP08_016937 [Theobroma cacao]|uniref:Uncharacterized protein n=1 Tax=Theobroma cacao TaxID=3641 RepID=A0A061ESI1_THECC|nr:Uncharacterized protein TCM_022115 [Theobroma cacao]WRX24450.1 hypothetical protein QQP08_016937 [Theobroma cacao]